MDNRMMATEQLISFRQCLQNEERSQATVEKYLREVRQFAIWLVGAPVAKTAVAAWKEHLLSEGYAPSTAVSYTHLVPPDPRWSAGREGWKGSIAPE